MSEDRVVGGASHVGKAAQSSLKISTQSVVAWAFQEDGVMSGFSNHLVFPAKAIISSWRELGGPAVAPREIGTELLSWVPPDQRC